MSRVILALGITTVALAGASVYLARELGIERARSAALEKTVARANAVALSNAAPGNATTAGSAASRGSDASSAANASAPSAAGAARGAAAPASGSRASGSSPYENKAVREALLRDRLAQYTDPERRGEILESYRADLRRRLAGIGEKVGLTPEEESRLLDLMLDDQMNITEADARCQVERVRCDPGVYRQQAEALIQAEVALLGRDRYERFVTYHEGYADRVQVQQLRARLPDGEMLSDAQADNLATMLSEERRKFTDEAKQRGDDIGGFGTQAGYLVTYSQRDTTNRAAQNLQSAEEFSQRMRDRASEVLSASQMDAYQQMQNELLSYLREQARREQIAQSALATDKQR